MEVVVDFRHHDDAVARERRERLAEDRLGQSVAVGARRVEEVDADLVRSADRGDQRLPGLLAPEFGARLPGPEADRTDHEAGPAETNASIHSDPFPRS